MSEGGGIPECSGGWSCVELHSALISLEVPRGREGEWRGGGKRGEGRGGEGKGKGEGRGGEGIL